MCIITTRESVSPRKGLRETQLSVKDKLTTQQCSHEVSGQRHSSVQVAPLWLRPASTACRRLSLRLLPTYLLVLAQRLLLPSQARSLLRVRLVRGRYLVGLRPCTTAHLTPRPRGFVDESAARALPAHLGVDGL